MQMEKSYSPTLEKGVGDSSPRKETEFGDMGMKNIAVCDQEESSLDTTEMSDSFIVDIENLSQDTVQEISSNSRISVKLQRNLSRKGSQRAERNKTTLASSGVTDGSSDGSKTAGTLSTGGCNPDKSTPAPVMSSGSKELSKQPQQAITITAENRFNCRRSFKQRTSASIIDPRRVLFYFATLSSVGTLLLIYFTLSITKFSGDSTTHAQYQ
ncbi:hypothetical protein IFM89_007319 [Coptis chinensis]|uniref:Uncharacterized protein n=1 Tax=Coptis chinensis TaxID=261450 RepID=A0A835GY56_9MAGN|nr:hypothetical protein IFM89_007319 [Coptis chinensis]